MISDPAGLGSNVNGIASGTVSQAVTRFGTALTRAREAKRLATGGSIGAAITEWRNVFRDYFPA
jgi:hypothetical protein